MFKPMRKMLIVCICFILYSILIVFVVVNDDNKKTALENKILINSTTVKVISQQNKDITDKYNELLKKYAIQSKKLDAAQRHLNLLNKTKISIDQLTRDNLALRKTVTKKAASRGSTVSRSFRPKVVKPISDYVFKKDLGIWNISFYTPSADECGGDTSGVTASGRYVVPGYTVAADISRYPFGTKFYIEGYGVVEVQDVGGAIRKNKLDICVLDKSYAFALGRIHPRVWLIEEEK